MFIHEEKLIVNCFLLLLNICLLTFPTSCLKKKKGLKKIVLTFCREITPK